MTDVTNDPTGPGAETTLESAKHAAAAVNKAGFSVKNMSVGDSSIPDNAIGIGNTALGDLALGELTSGNYNVAIGAQALREKTTGSDNTAVGAAAEGVNTAGNRNTSMGSSAGLLRTSGSDNTAVGFAAMGNVVAGGDHNVALGRHALANYPGSFSVAIGSLALRETTGDHNTAIGNQAGLGVTTGGRGVYIGYRAGGVAGQHGNADNAIVIGAEAVAARDAQIVLGTSAQDELMLFDFPMFRKAGLGGQAVFIGGAGNLTATGGANVVIGPTAGFSLVNADSNTLIGYEAGYNVTSGGNNVAVGARALLAATVAGDCTAVGAGALNKMVTGVGTTAVGRYSMQCLRHGGNNTAIGDASGRNLYGGEGPSDDGGGKGEQNCLVGYGVMRFGYYNSYNVVIGQGALYNAGRPVGPLPEDGGTPTGPGTPSNYNVVVGHLAFENTTGGGHTGLGANAGRSLTGGADTIFIGLNAGFGEHQKADAAGSIAIGVGAIATRDNEIVIGKAADTHFTVAGVTFTKAQLEALLAIVL